jgi:hypothetical protein
MKKRQREGCDGVAEEAYPGWWVCGGQKGSGAPSASFSMVPTEKYLT